GIEVVGAHDLVAKDGQGSSTTFVELEFDDQKFRTTTKDKDLSPIWNEIFYFNITDPSKLPNLNLDACIYHYNNKSNGSKIPLGKVRLTGTSFVPYSDAVVLHYPLEKKGIFSRTKGELGLKVFIIDDPSLRASNPLPAMQEPFVNNVINSTDESLAQDQIPASFTNQILNNVFKKKNESVHTFHNLPKSNDGKEKKSNVTFGMHEMKSGQSAPKGVKAFAGGAAASAMDYGVKETSPSLGGGKVVGGRV
ncbi:multiple C2 and transmembrane domain-containing protein 2-like, partial [Trifolium medium]|nr:multiple C2 and transmembrane domain-containing protein 2-like [Trifolium medium]